jgi:prepilin-type N-terminal cleavage/methylation domain-containing protein
MITELEMQEASRNTHKLMWEVTSMLKKLRKNKKGFTLAELLIVVAIIGVLVAISIPIFTSQLEKSREAVDLANIRSAYAEASAAAITDDQKTTTEDGTTITYTPASGTTAATYSVDVKITQQTAEWVIANPQCAGKDLTNVKVNSDDTVTVSVATDGTVNIAKKTATQGNGSGTETATQGNGSGTGK